jgi:polysaccharide biosynthesis protein PslH
VKRILLAKPVLPYPPDQGTKVVSFGMIEALTASYDVTVLARLLDPGEDVHVRSLEKTGARVVTVLPANRTSVPARVAYKLAYGTRSVLTGRSLKSLYDCPGATVRAARALARERFDWFIVEYWQMYPLLDVFPPERTALLTHDIDMLVSRERARFDRDVVSRVKASTSWRVEAREEKSAYQRAGHVWTLTKRDADTVATIAGRKADVMPVGLAAEFFVDDPAARDSREVLLVGAMHSPFNRDAIDHFVEDIHPALSSIPGVRFTVVGGALPPEVVGFERVANVEITGHARDIRPYLQRAACLVVPLRFAGGIRIRILCAMAAGLPVVCSPVAVEGMGFEAGRHVLIAESPAEYRGHIERLLDDRAFALGLARAARERVWRSHGPDTRGPGLVAFLRGVMGDNAS